jgi:hypothetical protein
VPGSLDRRREIFAPAFVLLSTSLCHSLQLNFFIAQNQSPSHDDILEFKEILQEKGWNG